MALKPPGLIQDPNKDEPDLYLVYVDATSFHEIHIPCTKRAWIRVEGGPHTDKEPHPGLDMQSGLRFAVILTPDGKEATDVDVMPATLWERGMIPEDMKDIKQLEVEVDPVHGSLRVWALPPKISGRTVDGILKAIDGLEQISAGDTLTGGHQVTQIAGNRVSIKVSKA